MFRLSFNLVFLLMFLVRLFHFFLVVRCCAMRFRSPSQEIYAFSSSSWSHCSAPFLFHNFCFCFFWLFGLHSEQPTNFALISGWFMWSRGAVIFPEMKYVHVSLARSSIAPELVHFGDTFRILCSLLLFKWCWNGRTVRFQCDYFLL